MSIDICSEELLTLEQAAQSLPGRPARSTVWRWCRHGVRGIRLSSLVIGGKRFTSLRSLGEFATALTVASEPASSTNVAVDTPPERDPSTERRLKEVGLL